MTEKQRQLYRIGNAIRAASSALRQDPPAIDDDKNEMYKGIINIAFGRTANSCDLSDDEAKLIFYRNKIAILDRFPKLRENGHLVGIAIARSMELHRKECENRKCVEKRYKENIKNLGDAAAASDRYSVERLKWESPVRDIVQRKLAEIACDAYVPEDIQFHLKSEEPMIRVALKRRARILEKEKQTIKDEITEKISQSVSLPTAKGKTKYGQMAWSQNQSCGKRSPKPEMKELAEKLSMDYVESVKQKAIERVNNVKLKKCG